MVEGGEVDWWRCCVFRDRRRGEEDEGGRRVEGEREQKRHIEGALSCEGWRSALLRPNAGAMAAELVGRASELIVVARSRRDSLERSSRL